MNPAVKQGLDLTKKNIPSIACGAGVLLALGAYFIYPIPGMYETFNTETKAAAAKYSELNTLVTAKYPLPTAFNIPGSDPKQLETFPTQRVIDVYKKAGERFSDEANQLVRAAIATNTRLPLVQGVFPEAQRGLEVTKYREFKEAYARKYNTEGKAIAQAVAGEILGAALPPTQAELTSISQSIAQRIRRERTDRDAANRITNQQEVDQLIAEAQAKALPDERQGRAERSKVYLSPGALSPLPGMVAATAAGGINPAETSIVTLFNAQVGLWLHEAIATAIARTNASASNVFDAPIKHVAAIGWADQLIAVQARTTGFQAGGLQAGPEGAAAPAVPEPSFASEISRDYRQSPWGHHSNNAYDIIPFKLVLRVDARRVSEVLVSLTRDQFIFIDNVSFTSVDTNIAKQQGYIYGDAPIIELELDCTFLILRSWTIPIMPVEVRAAIAAASAGPAVAQ